MNLKDEFGQIEPGKQRLDRSTQRDQARRFVDFIQGLKREVCSLVRPDDRDRGVGREARLGLAVGKVEPPRQDIELLVG